MFKYLHDIQIAVEAIIANKLRSVLTALGIIFGVAAVISMLAIGNGAKQEILHQMEQVGVNNIIISASFKPKKENGSSGENNEIKKISKGLNLQDYEAIRSVLPTIKRISPELLYETNGIYKENQRSINMLGIAPDYFEMFNINLKEGNNFSQEQIEKGLPVCIISEEVQVQLFKKEKALGKYLKCGNNWLRIIGISQKKNMEIENREELDITTFTNNVYIPVKTMIMRYQNRALITPQSFSRRGGGNNYANYHQLDKITVQVQETEQLIPSKGILQRLISKRHSGVQDFKITVPEVLLKQKQRTKNIFNIVLGAIASISLLVGGIGIMNIMFASVMERIKEIGIRMAIGGKQNDIIVQFLSEAVLISVTGGFIGIVLGVTLSFLIESIAGIPTIVSPASVLLAFLVSATVGVIFGYSPARKAALRDPIESLRYE